MLLVAFASVYDDGEVEPVAHAAPHAEDQAVVGALTVADRGAERLRVRAHIEIRQAAQAGRRIAIVVAEADVEIAPVDVDVVRGDRRRAGQLVRPSDVCLPRIRLLEERRRDLSEERDSRRIGLVLALDGRDRIADAEERPVRFPDAGGVVHREDRPVSHAARIDGREQHVCVRVAEVLIDAPPGADDVAAVALHVIREADARLEVVDVVFRLLTERIHPLHSVEAAGLARRLERLEVRIL